jgi:predicted DNA-binding transcriptional regulator AlpA
MAVAKARPVNPIVAPIAAQLVHRAISVLHPAVANAVELLRQAERRLLEEEIPAQPAPASAFDIAKLPPLLRLADIVQDRARNYAGLLPISRKAFLTAVAEGYIPKPVKLGGRAVAWRREDILAIARHGVQGRRPRGSGKLKLPDQSGSARPSQPPG